MEVSTALREEAIRKLESDSRPLPEGEPFTVDFYRPEDGYGLSRLVYKVYGDAYPVDTFYRPELISEENRSGRIRSVVARTADHQVVSHIALYRSSPPNPALYEYGLGITLPTYRKTRAFVACNRLLMTLPGRDGVDAFFGEAVCNHTTTQKLTRHTGTVETGLELSLMPARAYEAEQSADSRVACMMAFKVYHDHNRPLSLPECYRVELEPIVSALMLDRTIIEAASDLPDGPASLSITRFEHAGVARCSIEFPGSDLRDRLRLLESGLRSQNFALLQCFVPLANSWGVPIVNLLRQEGFFLGGFLPVWFGEDGLLMQKLFVDPEFESVQIHSPEMKRLAAFIQADWQTVSKSSA
mgnify:CR=1 FL=1